jgi:hypothetical protein
MSNETPSIEPIGGCKCQGSLFFLWHICKRQQDPWGGKKLSMGDLLKIGNSTMKVEAAAKTTTKKSTVAQKKSTLMQPKVNAPGFHLKFTECPHKGIALQDTHPRSRHSYPWYQPTLQIWSSLQVK